MLKRIGLAAALAAIAFAGAAGTANARYWGNGQWHQDHRDWNHHWYGNHYQAPPVVYGTPYNYGYTAPPVIYGGEPGGINLNVHIP